uniref:Reticulon 3 n=1 Tax=Gorilla gorilla gorilla TaxID=9595 RepID=A0A2I2YES2_GORGO
MAEPSAATQSHSISSSSFGAEPSAPGGGGSPGACPALGTKSCSSSCAGTDLGNSSDYKCHTDQLEESLLIGAVLKGLVVFGLHSI